MLILLPVIECGLVAAQEQGQSRDFIRLYEPFCRLGGEQDIVDDLVAGQAAGLHRVGNLPLDQPVQT